MISLHMISVHRISMHTTSEHTISVHISVHAISVRWISVHIFSVSKHVIVSWNVKWWELKQRRYNCEFWFVFRANKYGKFRVFETTWRKYSLQEKGKGKLGPYAMKRVAAGGLPTPWLFDDRADYCLKYSFPPEGIITYWFFNQKLNSQWELQMTHWENKSDFRISISWLFSAGKIFSFSDLKTYGIWE